jgi:hypothetical protein
MALCAGQSSGSPGYWEVVQVPMDLGKKACATLLHLSMILPNGISGRLVSEVMVGKDKYSKNGDSEGTSVA